VSVFTRRPIRNDVAITGEIDLRGNALPIGGVKEKVLAAHRAGIKRVILPDKNKKDMPDVPDEIRAEMTFYFCSRMEEVLELALGVENLNKVKKDLKAKVKKAAAAKATKPTNEPQPAA
jgi:ATP-dependent Lon protease